MDVELPDGTMIQGVPDGMSKADLTNHLVAKGYGKSLASKEDVAMASPTKDMSWADKFLAGAGKSFADIGLGARQIFADTADKIAPKGPTLSGLVTGKTASRGDEIRKEVDETKARDRPLMGTGGGITGNLAGGLSMAIPTAFMPGANTYTGAALAGGMMGALNPVATGESRGMNTVVGGGLGAGAQLVGNVAGRMIRPVRSSLNPEQERLAGVAGQEGIPLSAAQQTGSKPLSIIDSIFENLPFTAGSQAAQKQAQQGAYNAAVLRKSGTPGELATPDVLVGQKKALGKTFEDIASRNSIDFNHGVKPGVTVTDELTNVVTEAGRRLTPDKAGVISRAVDDMLTQVDHAGRMAGTNYQGWRETLGRMAKGNDSEAHFASELKKVLDRAFSSQVSGADAEAWKTASRQYGNIKTTANAMGGAGVAPTAGNISPAQLSSAVASQVSREGKALGRGELNDLVRVGQQFIREPIPNSGTAQRMLYQSLLTGGAGGAAYAAGNDPKAGLGAAAIGLLSPKGIQMLMQSQAGREYLTKGILAMRPGQQGALNAGARGILAGPLSVNAAQE